MLLCNLYTIGNDSTTCIHIENGTIKDILNDEQLISESSPALRLYFDNAIAFPGLINSHDHLEFNLFPRLGNQVYESYIDWGADIQKQNKKLIEAITKIPKQYRVQWGIYKNLLNGITTVIHHGEYLNIEKAIIDVFQDWHSLHSVGREKNWKLKLNNPFASNHPFVIHVGEGTNKESFEEITRLIRWNFAKRKLIGVHGVSMTSQQAKAFEALIWCPDSNFFLLNATAAINKLKSQTTILFGTDSTVSASWNLWEQLRLARHTNMLTDGELLDTLTTSPAYIWKLNNKGSLKKSKTADIVVARQKNDNDLIDSFFQLNPEDILLIIKTGKIILFDQTLEPQLNKTILNDFCKININGIVKLVKGDLRSLINEITKFNPEAAFPITI